MIVKLDKCRCCGILREKTISGECAVCGSNDFVEVLFCDEHHAETNNGVCPYCENEKAQRLSDKQDSRQINTTVKTADPQSPSAAKVSQPLQPPIPQPVPIPKPVPIPQPVPIQQPTQTPVPNVKTEKSGLGCWGCLVWPAIIIFIIWLICYLC